MVQTPLSTQNLYPDSDGKPMAENTLQYRWIVRLVTNLKHLLREQVALVAGDLLWYPEPVSKPPAPAQAPDAMVVLGRPPGDRGSYKQWEEENIAPQVVFEILSPSNTLKEMTTKQTFYEKYGVLEMYFYEPDTENFWGFTRSQSDQGFMLITPLHLPWTSPLLNIRFELRAEGLTIFYPNGEPFKEPEALILERDQIQAERDQIQAERDQIQAERDQIQAERDQIQAERDQARLAQTQTQTKLERALEQLKALGLDPDQI